MIKTIVDAIKECGKHIRNIKSFRYEGVDLINQQNNNSTIQLIVEDDIFSEYLITKDMLKVSLNIDIFDKCFQEDNPLDIHDKTTKMGIVLISLLEVKYGRYIHVYDYSFMNISRYSDDALYGTRISLSLVTPSPIDACNIEDLIDVNNDYDKEKDNQIDLVPQIDVNALDIDLFK